MTSIVGICNQAILKAGGNPITALTQDNREARLCSALFEPVKDAMLTETDWSVVTELYALSPLSEPPAFGYSYQFQLPPEVELCRHVSEDGENFDVFPWQVFSNKVLCNAESIKIIAIRKLTNVAELNSLEEAALVARLAAELAIPLSQSNSLANQFWTEYGLKVDLATARDGQQGTYESTDIGQLVKVRYSRSRVIPGVE